jgi:hypothetical protein
MDSNILRCCLEKLNELTDNEHLTGCYSADRLPRKCKKPIALIAHSEAASIPTGHWVAIYVPKRGPIYFFDSYGMEPHVQTHLNFMHRMGGRIIYNTNCYQGFDAVTCGGYSLLFLASKMGYINSFKKYLSQDKENNDNFIKTSTKTLIEDLGVDGV